MMVVVVVVVVVVFKAATAKFSHPSVSGLFVRRKKKKKKKQKEKEKVQIEKREALARTIRRRFSRSCAPKREGMMTTMLTMAMTMTIGKRVRKAEKRRISQTIY